jgi:hypothetical protein
MEVSSSPTQPFGVTVSNGEIHLTLSGKDAALLAVACRRARPDLATEEAELGSLEVWSKLFATAATAAACQWLLKKDGLQQVELELKEIMPTV